ncbi:hypothetical protein [Marinobacter sp. S6332]|uniref:hypothetical protein n=1 Tax=Marinobacter sp. S6332 TaxID=2926403 RepID=UPI001FF525FF|nr:hypothetical protein [Marinobacter sp. S6332]MCK0165385.1 hypothetical protein [Marinobacter sp. S6332]
MFYVRHPITRKQGSLQTDDKDLAIRRWAILNQMWEEERREFDAELMAGNLSMCDPMDDANRITLKEYLHTWRTESIGHRVVNGRTKWGKCNVFSQRGPNRGKPIALGTRIDYASDAQQLEASEASDFLLADPQLLRRIRRLLSGWLTKPTHYNGLRNTLSRVFTHAVQDGLIDRNPMRDIQKISEPKREVLIPDEIYKEITTRLCVHQINRRIKDGTWRAKICDLIYMMSQQPIDVFGLKEEQIRDDQSEFGEIHFARHKTGVPIVIEMNEELRDLIEWFRDWKKSEDIISPYLMVYPRYFDFRSRTRPVRHRYIQIAWAQACEEAGYKGQYQLRDLRKKGLTDEFLSQGENNKGGHETEAMRKHYRLIRPPERSKSTLKSPRDTEKN